MTTRAETELRRWSAAGSSLRVLSFAAVVEIVWASFIHFSKFLPSVCLSQEHGTRIWGLGGTLWLMSEAGPGSSMAQSEPRPGHTYGPLT